MATKGEDSQASSDGAAGVAGEVQVTPSHVFGLRKEVRGAIAHLDAKTVLYPAGAFLVSHDTETHSQKVTVLQRPDPPTAMAVSMRRQLLAVCLAGAAQDPSGDYIRTEGELPSVSIYDLNTHPMRRVRSLVCGDVASHEYVSASFSCDERVVGVQGGSPDWTLVLFLIEKSKVLSVFRLGDSPGLLSVCSIAFHPEDPGVLTVVGRKALRFLKLHDKLLKGYGYQAGLQHMCCSLVWADHYTLLVGTEEGTILLMEEGELKTTIVIEDQKNKTEKREKKEQSLSKSGRGSQEDPGAADEVGGSAPRHKRVTCIAMFNDNFACACGPDKIFLFQKSDNIQEFYLQRHRLLVCAPSPASLVSGRGQHTVTSLSADPSASSFVLATHTGQIFTNVIPSLDDSQVASSVFRPFHTQHHSSAIVSADVCFWKPYCSTVARDRSFLLWDYELHLLLLQYTFKEDLYCVALHPTGFHAAVAFTDSLRFYHVMMDDLRLYWEVRVRRCSSCKFSGGGQYLAAADGSVVIVIHTVKLKRHMTLKGHAGKILGVRWHPSDLQVFATAADGGVLAWDVATGSLAVQLQTSQGCIYSQTYLSLDNKAAVVAGSSVHLVEVVGGQLMQEESVEDLSAVGVGAVKTLLVVGTSLGSVAFSRIPRSFAAGPIKPSPAHASRIVAICVTRDEGCVVTCGEDGVVVIWAVSDLPPDSPGALVAKDRLLNLPPHAPEMLVTREELQMSSRREEELSSEVYFLTRDKRHHLELQQQQHAAALEQLREAHAHERQELQRQVEREQQELQRLREAHELELQKVLADGESSLKEQAKETRQKLLFEYSKQDKLEQKFRDLEIELNKKIVEVERETRKQCECDLVTLKKRESELQDDLLRAEQRRKEEEAEHMEAMKLQEALMEAEVAGVRQQLHSLLQEERQTVAMLRKQKASYVQSNEKLQRETQTHKHETIVLQKEKAAMLKEKDAALKDVGFLREEVKQKEETIAAKEKEIARSLTALRALQQQLDSEKQQVVELKLCQEPMFEEINQKDLVIKQLSEAHSTAKMEVGSRARQTKNLARRLAGARKEQTKLTHRLHCRTVACTRLLDGLACAVTVINAPDQLKEVIRDLNERHLSVAEHRGLWTRPALNAGTRPPADDEKALEGSDSEAARELLRQRQRLERAVAKLKSAAVRKNAAHAQARSVLVKENSKLLTELTALRETTRKQAEEIRQLQSLAPRPRTRF